MAGGVYPGGATAAMWRCLACDPSLPCSCSHQKCTFLRDSQVQGTPPSSLMSNLGLCRLPGTFGRSYCYKTSTGFFTCSLYYLRGRETQGIGHRAESSHLLVHSSKHPTRWLRLEPGTRNISHVSQVGDRNSITRALITVRCCVLPRSWNQESEPGSKPRH